MIKCALRADWGVAANDIVNDVASTHKEAVSQKTAQDFSQQTLPTYTTNLMLNHVKGTKKSHGMSSKK